MKRIYKICIALLLISSTGCQEDFLHPVPPSDYSDMTVWSDPALIEAFVNNIYRGALHLPFSIAKLSDFVDESNFTPDWGVTAFNKCRMSSDGLKGWTESAYAEHFTWEPLYKTVRACNLFFVKMEGAEFEDQEHIDRMYGEVYFLRAYLYHYLAAMYGGVPIITKPYEITDDFEISRNTYAETIDYITGQLDTAIVLLPLDYNESNAGRATKGAAMHLKARALLYAASDLHHDMASYAPGFSNPELLGYTDNSQAQRWLDAKEAAMAVIELGIYGLYRADPAPGDSIAQNFVDYFISYGYENEDILLQYFTSKTDEDWDGYNPGLYCGPNGYHNWGNATPLGELVDDYEMKDGSSFSWDNPEHAADPYSNRDARFYATILYEGCPWRVRPSDVQEIDPWNRIQVGAIYDESGDKVIPGLDTRQGPIEDWNGSKTGYYTRKFIDPAVDHQYDIQDIPFRYFRYGEVLLNYAEACLESGDEDEARTYLNMIRKRAGQPDITESGDDLRQRYRQERRIEMAYEDQRFWDVRRWLIGSVANVQTHGVSVKYETTLTAEEIPNYRQPDGSTWVDPVYSEIKVAGDKRSWDNKAYFFPIMRDEMNKNTLLVQNPGYSD